jgi:hypothetical protein
MEIQKLAGLLLAAAVLPALAANVSGRWNIDGDVQGNPVKAICELKQEGSHITGTCKAEDRDPWKLTGKVEESNITFTYDVEHDGQTYTLVYTGTMDGDSAMKGQIEVAGVTGDFTAKKE